MHYVQTDARCRDACQISERYDTQNFMRFGGKTSYRLMNKGPGVIPRIIKRHLYGIPP